MKGLVRGGCVAFTAVALVVSMAGVSVAAPKAKKQAAAKYAKTVCGTYTALLNDITTYATAISNLDTSDPATFQTQAAGQTTPLISTIKAAETTLAGAYPDVSNGKKIGTLLVTNATELDTTLSDALTKLQADSTIAGPTVFKTNLAILNTKLSDPFSKITNQTLITAFQKEKSCKDVVQVTTP